MLGVGDAIGGRWLDASKSNILNIDAHRFQLETAKSSEPRTPHTLMLAHPYTPIHFVYNKNICNFLLHHEPIDVNTVQQNAVEFN